MSISSVSASRRHFARQRRSELHAWAFLAPALLAIVLVFGYPVVKLAQYSLSRRVGQRWDWVGFANYTALLKDKVFLEAAGNNLTMLLVIPLMLAVALLVAVLLHERVRGWQGYRSVLFFPYVLAIPVAGILWSYILQLNGALNTLLRSAGMDWAALDWLGNPKLALASVMFVFGWKEVGFGIVLFLARLLSVPEELYEAARLDGASWWRTHRHITLPQLRHVIEFYAMVVVITVLSWVFAYVFVMTGGGPGNSTMVTELYIYQMAFRYNNPGRASAVGMLLLLVTGILIYAHLRVRQGGEADAD